MAVKRSAVLFVLLSFIPSSCREIPPVIPEGYEGSAAAEGWPPPPTYDADPLHPANRWFHRAFGGRTAAGDIVPPRGDEPFSRLDRPSRVDVAELSALLEACARSAGPLEAPLFRTDLLAEAARSSVEGSPEAARELRPLLLAGARRVDGPGPPRRIPPEAPPLRQGTWTEEDPPGAPGLLPSAEDLRWTRRLRSRSGDGSRSVLMRQRVELDPAGSPALSPLPSECWELSPVAGGMPGGGMEPRVWRFDRVAWTAGREPWREIGPTETIAIRDPERAGAVIEGEMRILCVGCHGPGEAGRTRGTAPRPQMDLVREALEDALEPAGE